MTLTDKFDAKINLKNKSRCLKPFYLEFKISLFSFIFIFLSSKKDDHSKMCSIQNNKLKTEFKSFPWNDALFCWKQLKIKTKCSICSINQWSSFSFFENYHSFNTMIINSFRKKKFQNRFRLSRHTGWQSVSSVVQC